MLLDRYPRGAPSSSSGPGSRSSSSRGKKVVVSDAEFCYLNHNIALAWLCLICLELFQMCCVILVALFVKFACLK